MTTGAKEMRRLRKTKTKKDAVAGDGRCCFSSAAAGRLRWFVLLILSPPKLLDLFFFCRSQLCSNSSHSCCIFQQNSFKSQQRLKKKIDAKYKSPHPHVGRSRHSDVLLLFSCFGVWSGAPERAAAPRQQRACVGPACKAQAGPGVENDTRKEKNSRRTLYWSGRVT